MNEIPQTICPECGSKRFTLKGFDYCRKGTMRKYQCSECRRYFRDSITEEQKESIRNGLSGALEGGKITLNSSYGKSAQQRPFKDNVNQTNALASASKEE